jgi:hypothetical protein
MDGPGFETDENAGEVVSSDVEALEPTAVG